MKEIWKEIKGFEHEYCVSNKGRVMSLLGKSPRILKPRYNKSGYARVSLHAHSDYLIHRLVAQEFLDNPNSFTEVNHIDENPKNNCIYNLEWCTHKYNICYGTCQKRARKTQRKTFPQINRKDCSKQVECIETGEVYKSIHEAERVLNISRVTISKVCRGLRKTTGDLTFKFKETH